MDINQNVNNIIFFKVREVSKTNIEANEELYLNVQPLSYNKNDLSFLEDDTINDDANKFYEDLGDFAVNANSLLLMKKRKYGMILLVNLIKTFYLINSKILLIER